MIRSVIIAGSRSLSPTVSEIDDAISALDPAGLLWVPAEWTEIVCGVARGVDLAGKAWAIARGKVVWLEPVSDVGWRIHGKIAGKFRNRRMAERADAALIFWDGMSSGSCDMCCRMVARNKPVRVIPWR